MLKLISINANQYALMVACWFLVIAKIFVNGVRYMFTMSPYPNKQSQDFSR